MAAPDPAFLLAATNASINTVSAVLIVRARRFIRHGRVGDHRRLMIAATILQGLFLALYLAKAYLYGTTPFQGDPVIRAGYLVFLGVHMLAATVSAPLVVYALVLGLRRQDTRHRRIARWTYPIWLYVSVTGPLTFLLLYGLGRPGYGLQALAG